MSKKGQEKIPEACPHCSYASGTNVFCPACLETKAEAPATPSEEELEIETRFSKAFETFLWDHPAIKGRVKAVCGAVLGFLQSSLEAAKAEAAEANDIMREACAAKAAATKTWNFMFNKQEEKISALTEEIEKLKETLRTSSSENEERLTELLGEAKLRLSEMIPIASSYRRRKLGFDTDDIKSAEALLKRLEAPSSGENG